MNTKNNMTLLLAITLVQVTISTCCVAPFYRKPSLDELPQSPHRAQPGQVMHWITDVNTMRPKDFQLLKRLIVRHGAIIIKGQNMTQEQHLKFTEALGAPVPVPNSFFLHGDNVSGNVTIVPVSNYWFNGTWKGARLPYGQYWHKDMNFLPEKDAHIFSILYARDYRQGERGGTTGFIDACRARRDLPARLEKPIRNVKFQFGAELSGDYRKCALQSDLDYYVPVMKPIFFTHPIKKHECLNMAKTQFGFHLSPSNSSLEAVERAWKWVQEQPYYQHVWSQGDIAIWDNFSVFHKLLPYIDEGKIRSFERTYTRPQF